MDMYSGEIKKVACDQTENIEERDWKCQGTFDCLKQKEQWLKKRTSKNITLI